ncbi:MAG TPA: 3-isopropylmalate dehydratase small subunit [Dehalococcoidia bacterium]|nr:3-isopropylmalate dehydratase small subunit [Dehalococcoidia bacterium]
MEPFRRVRGKVMPLPRADVDTDQIIPAKHLKRIERTGFGQFAFEAWRQDPDFVANDPRYRDAPILVTGPNFGCGSSREHAPWALQDMGLKAIIAPSFADIFRNNCAKIGLLTVVLPQEDVDRIIARAEDQPGFEAEVDLESQTVSLGDGVPRHFEIDPFVRHCLLHGLDDISLTLQHDADIAAFEQRRPDLMPVTTAAGA